MRQLLAHLVLPKDCSGGNLSAGFWFICINFQLGLLYAVLLCLRDTAIYRNGDISKIVGWGLAAFSVIPEPRRLVRQLGALLLPLFLYGHPSQPRGPEQRDCQRNSGFIRRYLPLHFTRIGVGAWRWQRSLPSRFMSSRKPDGGHAGLKTRCSPTLGKISYSLFWCISRYWSWSPRRSSR